MIRPQLVELRNKVTNARLYPHLIHLRLSSTTLRKLPGFFHKPTMRPKEQ